MNPASTFDWAKAIETNSEALKAIIASLFAMLDFVTDGVLSRSLHTAVLRVLRPAESAVRRLVVIAARGVVVKLSPSRPMSQWSIAKGLKSSPSFKLFDPRKRFTVLDQKSTPRLLPRIHVFGPDPRVAALWAKPSPRVAKSLLDDAVSAEPLTRRIQALSSALDNLPRQARRLARWRLRREKVPNPKFTSPLRPGFPPGHRRKQTLEIDAVLAQCHYLAWEALRSDTS